MKKFKPISKEELEKLPEEVVAQVKNDLKAYNECDITYENEKYHIGCCMIKDHYAADHKFIGVAYAEDIYTLEERIENYRNEFHCEPYSLLKQLKEEKQNG
jgi:hypothetical protein